MILQDLRYDPPRLVLRWPQMASDDPQIDLPTHGRRNMAVFSTLLTVAERIWVMSKDWIRAPTQSQEYTNGY